MQHLALPSILLSSLLIGETHAFGFVRAPISSSSSSVHGRSTRTTESFRLNPFQTLQRHCSNVRRRPSEISSTTVTGADDLEDGDVVVKRYDSLSSLFAFALSSLEI